MISGNGLQVRRLALGGHCKGFVLCDAAGRMLPGQQRVALVTAYDSSLKLVVTFEVEGSDIVLALAEEAVERPASKAGQ